MAIKFYYGSGSPFAWNVWLVLEHKQLAYEFNLMALMNGDLKKPEYLAINPHGKVPTLIDDDFTIWESLAIVEYLEEKYRDQPILPSNLKDRATVRRLAAEAYNYLYPSIRRLMEETLFRPDDAHDSAKIVLCVSDLGLDLAYFDSKLQGDYFVGSLSLADFTVYPLLALVKRIHGRQPQHGVGVHFTPKLDSFMQRIEQLPYFNKTIPPHWKG